MPALKTIYLNWEEWQKYCAEHNIDPRKTCEDGHDLGGGNSITFECHDDPPEEPKIVKGSLKFWNLVALILGKEEE